MRKFFYYRFIFRLIILGFVIVSALVAYIQKNADALSVNFKASFQGNTVPTLRATIDPCSDSMVINWFKETSKIIESFDYTVPIAQSSYEQQRKIQAPECLKTAQELSVSYYWYSWQAALAHDEGDVSNVNYNVNKAEEAYNELNTELDRLATKYGWK